MSRIHTKPTRFLIALLALVAVTGCADSSGAGEPEDPGLLLVPPTDGGYFPDDLVWTRDGSELVYLRSIVVNGGSATVLNAASVSTHVVRAVYQSPSIVEVAPESAGGRIYFGAFLTTAGFNDPNFQVSRVHLTSGAVEVLATISLGARNDVVVSDDERYLAAVRGLYDLQAGTRIDLPAGIPIEFSPDKTQLLYLVDQTTTSIQSATLISTADGSSQPLHSTDYFVLAHRWEGNSPQLLSSALDLGGGVRLYEIDGLTGARRDIAEFTNSISSYIYANWSPDGQRLAVWIREGFGKARRTNLHIVRAGIAPAIVATIHGDPGLPVFSPNGNSVAYFYYHQNDTRSLYLKSGI